MFKKMFGMFRKVMGKERTLVVIDGGYLAAICKDIDMNRFRDIVFFYTGNKPDQIRWFGTRNPNFNDGWYFNEISALGIEYSVYPLVIRNHHCKACGEQDEKRVQKGVDVGIAVFIMNEMYKNSFDRLFLVGGDGDFIDVMNAVRHAKKEVYVMGTPDTVAGSIKSSVSRMIDISDMIKICKKGCLSHSETEAWKNLAKAIPQKPVKESA